MKVEQELRNKLSQMKDAETEKTDLKRRLEDLQSEVKHLQTMKFEKDEKLKMQIHKNEELLEELERLNVDMCQIKEEREMTL
jgi:peptidoglycan hydrolase CwlO-like protein